MKHLKLNLLFLAMMIIFSNYANTVFAGSTKDASVFIHPKLAALENVLEGRIGIYAINTANNQEIQYRASERFAIQSTFKLIAVSAMLKHSMRYKHLLQQSIQYKKPDLVFWSPITAKHIKTGMTIAELCAATMMFSDNAATNLIVRKLGGPLAVNAFAKSIGNSTFSIENWEPDLNSNPLDARDSATPKAMGKTLQKLALGNVLAAPQREQLVKWMKANTTGDARIRAGVPKGWVVADKTGAGSYGISNDIAVIWPPHCSPIVMAIYTVQNIKDAIRRDDVLATITRILIAEFALTDSCLKLNLNQA